MKKETGIAVGLGVFFGLLFSFVVILNTQTNKAVSQKKQSNQTRPASSTQNSVVVKPIEVTSPNDRALFDTNKAEVKMKVEKGSFIVIQTPSQDITQEAESENVSTTVPLTLGENIIHISVYAKGGGTKVQEKELKVYYIPTQ